MEVASQLIARLYDAALDERLWEPFLSDLATSFGSDQALLLNVDTEPLPDGVVQTVGMDMDVVTKWEGSKEHVDVWYQGVQERTYSSTYRGRDLCPRKVFRRSAFYTDTLKHLDIEHTLGGISIENEFRNWVVAIFRSRRAGRFSDEQEAVYRCLVPHFGRAIKMGQLFSRKEQEHLTFVEGIDKLRHGVVILDDHQTVIHANLEAERIFRESKAISINLGKVYLVDRTAQSTLDKALYDLSRTLLDHNNEFALSASQSEGLRPINIVIYPVSQTGSSPISFSRAHSLMFIHDPENRPSISIRLLKQMYGLTHAEASTCAALFKTGSLTQAAWELGIKRNTAKTHLSRIFRKIEVSSQAQLLQTISIALAGIQIEA